MMVVLKQLCGLWWNRSFRCWVMSLILYKASIGFVSALPDLTPVYTYQEEGSCAWQANNTLQILDTPPIYDLDGITKQYFYEPQTQTLSAESGLPYRFSMLNRTSPIFPPIGMIQHSDYTARTGVYPSPDGRYVVYVTNVSDGGRVTIASIALANLETKKSTILPTGIYPNNVTIQWGFGSNAFVIFEEGNYGSDPFITYVSGFEASLEELSVVQVTGYSELAEKLQWDLYQIHDIDSTGQYILAEGYFRKPAYEPRFLRLMLINMQDFSYEMVSEDRFFVTARFEQPGNQKVFYYNSGGVFAYDRQSKTREFLNNAVRRINKNYWRTCVPTISPDGRYIAFDDEDGSSDVIVVPIKEHD